MHDCNDCSPLCRRLRALRDRIRRPVLRQTIRYRADLLPNEGATDRAHTVFRLDGTHACPLWRVVLLGLLVLLVAALALGTREDS